VEQYGAGEAYLPLLEALGRLGRTPAREALVTALRQQAPSWLGQLPALVSAEEYATLARQAPGLTRERMLRELAEALEGVTATQPLLMVLEDLHWSDVSTVEWLSYAARRRDRAQLLIVGTYRPGEAIARHHPLHLVVQELQRQGHALDVPLPYWSVTEVTAYLVQRFDAVPLAPDVVQLLHQRTKGNPFFLVTVVDALVRQGVLRAGASGWALVGGLEAVTTGVPESVRQLIEQQLEQIPPEDRAILETASVVGVEFSAVAVAAGMDQAEEVIEARCAVLARRGQFIHARSATDWPDGTVTAQYGFLHALHQAVLYEQVPPHRRMRCHRQVGARLEAGYGARARDTAVELADHFVRGHDVPRAVQYLQYAGEQALQRSAYQEASAHFTRGLDLLQVLPDTVTRTQQAIDLRLALRQALHPLGEYTRVLASLQEAEALALALDDQPRRGHIAVYMASCYRMLGDHAGAMATSQRALATAAGDVAVQVVARHLLGQSYYSIGDFRQAQKLFHKNIALLTGEQQLQFFGLSYLPAVGSRTFLVFCLTQLGAFAEARGHGEASVLLAEAAQHPMSLIFAHRSLCRLDFDRGDFGQAIPRIEQVIALCRRWHLRDGLSDDLSQLGYAYAVGGRLAEGLPLLEQSVARSHPLHQARFYARLSRGCLLADRLREADAHAQRAIALAYTHGEQSAQAWSLHLRADLATRSTPPDVAQAEVYYEQARTLAEELGMRPLQAHCHRGLGTLYATTGQQEQARTALSAAVDLYQAMKMTFWLPETEAALAQVEGR
jgi:tetratricopeptide (TPR) repeat protein